MISGPMSNSYLRASRCTSFHITQESSARMMKGQTSLAGPPPSKRRLRSSSKLWWESSLIRKWAAPVRKWRLIIKEVNYDGSKWHFLAVCLSPIPAPLKTVGSTSMMWLGQYFLYTAISYSLITRMCRCEAPSIAWNKLNRPCSWRPVVGVKIGLLMQSGL